MVYRAVWELRVYPPKRLFECPNAIFAAEAERDQVQALFDNSLKDSFDDLLAGIFQT